MEQTVGATAPEMASQSAKEQKSWVVALVLAFFLGLVGAHRFYLGKTVSGVIMLILTVVSPLTLFLTLGIASIWNLIDLILIFVGSLKDSDGQELKK